MARCGPVDNTPMTSPTRTEARRGVGPLRWGRILAVAGAWVVIIAVGRTVAPATTRADSTRSPQAGAVVGTLVGREYIVRIVATQSGPRYTVSTLSGQVLQTNLDAGALAKAFPGLDPSNLRAAPGALMQADTGE